MSKINTSTGVMEKKATRKQVVNAWIKHLKEIRSNGEPRKLVAYLIPNSKNHNGKDMIVIGEQNFCDDRKQDISCYNMEISENGIFFYIVDDSIS